MDWEATEFSGFSLIPIEITGVILEFATHTNINTKTSELVRIGGDQLLNHVVCRFVCHQWRDLLPKATPTEAKSFASCAGQRGLLAALIWAKANGCRSTSSKWICSAAAKGGHFEALKWLREAGCHWGDSVCPGAAAGGHFEILKWALERNCPMNEEETCVRAAKGGHLDILRWLCEEKECVLSANVFKGAAEGGHLHVLKWLRERGGPYDPSCYSLAALGGHTHVLEWLRKQGYPGMKTVLGRLLYREGD